MSVVELTYDSSGSYVDFEVYQGSTVLDLTGKTVTVACTDRNGIPLVSSSASLTDPANGKCRWLVGNLPRRGLYLCQLTITGGGTVRTLPVSLEVV